MKVQILPRFLLTASLALTLHCGVIHSAFATQGDGTNTGGGGDPSEARINEIRADILKWLSDGGARGLTLPPELSPEAYESQMEKFLVSQAVVVGFVTTAQESAAQDAEQKVMVNGQAKTCRGFISRKDRLPHILCNTERFGATSDADQYRLVHHEYAGLAGVEQNIGAASDYAISNQLTDFLTPQTVLRLSLRRMSDVIKPCGNLDLRKVAEGTVCRTSKFNGNAASQKGLFQLIKRTAKGHEVWKDLYLGFYWGDTLRGSYTQIKAKGICQKFESIDERGNLTDVAFILPHARQFDMGEENGYREVLPNMVHPMHAGLAFWTQSARGKAGTEGWAASGDTGQSNVLVDVNSSFSVRCVGTVDEIPTLH